MNRFNRSVLFTSGIFLALISVQALSVSAQRNWAEFKQMCESQGGVAYPNPARCEAKPKPANNTPSTTEDNSAAEKAERDRLAREAEDKRLADEAKAKKEAAERQKAFEKSRDEALQTIKGSGGNTGIRGITTGDPEIKGSSPSTGIRDGVTATPVSVPAEDAATLPFRQAIANAFPNSKPEVTDRIDKGFQLIVKPPPQDWKAAKAWFQDALNREPGNVGIKRLIALCDYTMTKPAPTPAQLPEPPKTKTYAELEAWRQDFMARQDKIAQEQFQRSLNEFYLKEASKHPELRMKVIVKPAPPAAKKPEMTLEQFRQNLQDFMGIPRPKRVTAVVAVRG